MIKTIFENIKIKDKVYQHKTTFSYCPECGEEWYTGEQLKQDSDRKIILKRRAMGLLTPQEIKAIRAKHNISIKEAANLFSCHVEQWQDFENGTQHQSCDLDKLLRIFYFAPDLIQKTARPLPFLEMCE